MELFDVIVVGAGPAGGQCARDLSKQGFKVLLVEKAKSFLENNFSSGGGPLEMMKEFDLPESIVGTFWNRLIIESTNEKASWTSPSPFGPILDFDQLRQFLADETVAHGGVFKLGMQYHSHSKNPNGIDVQLKNLDTEEICTYQTRLLVEATGTERKVMEPDYDKTKAVGATGIEFHVTVSPEIYQKYSQSMHFFLGHRWMPQGYGWIFAMAPNKLKVGVIRYFQDRTYVPHVPSYRHYLDQLLALCGPYELEDRHGKTVHYTVGQRDCRIRDGVIAIGDAISGINPLGWEGIRHALVSGKEAAKAIGPYLRGEISTLNDYSKKMDHYFGYKWFLSELLMKSLFSTRDDKLIDRSVCYFKTLRNADIINVIFNYRFGYALKIYCWYCLSKVKEALRQRSW